MINSNLGRIFHRFRDMVSFTEFSNPLHSTPNLKMFFLH